MTKRPIDQLFENLNELPILDPTPEQTVVEKIETETGPPLIWEAPEPTIVSKVETAPPDFYPRIVPRYDTGAVYEQQGTGYDSGAAAHEVQGRVPKPDLVPTEEKPRKRILDTDSATRKTYPMFSGLLAYFPDALAEVSKVSYIGNQKHNPGEDMHHARGKSMDHADCIMRHLSNHGGFDGDMRESAAMAWRALALLQQELEDEFGLPLPRGAKF